MVDSYSFPDRIIEMKPMPRYLLDAAFEIGKLRTEISRVQGRVSADKSGHQSGGPKDIESAVSELIFACEYSKPWVAINGFKGCRDVGNCEIQSTQLGRQLLLREYDLRSGVSPETPYVLTWIDMSHLTYAFVGWISLEDGLQHPNKDAWEEVWLLNGKYLHKMDTIESAF